MDRDRVIRHLEANQLTLAVVDVDCAFPQHLTKTGNREFGALVLRCIGRVAGVFGVIDTKVGRHDDRWGFVLRTSDEKRRENKNKRTHIHGVNVSDLAALNYFV